MFVFNGFTEKANNAINKAIGIASALGHTCIGSEHLLCGLLYEEGSVAATLLEKNSVTAEDVEQKLKETFGAGIQTSLSPGDLTPRSKRILENAIYEARRLGHKYVGNGAYPAFHSAGGGLLCGDVFAGSGSKSEKPLSELH